MKLTKTLLAIALAASFTTGCNSTHKSALASKVCTKVYMPLKADMNIGEKITGNAKSTVILGLFEIGAPNAYAAGVFQVGLKDSPLGALITTPLDKLKAAAAYNALGGSHNVIVAPNYTVKVNDYFIFKKYDVTVCGKEGEITNIKNK
jgi:hypothetical protein